MTRNILAGVLALLLLTSCAQTGSTGPITINLAKAQSEAQLIGGLVPIAIDTAVASGQIPTAMTAALTQTKAALDTAVRAFVALPPTMNGTQAAATVLTQAQAVVGFLPAGRDKVALTISLGILAAFVNSQPLLAG